MSQRKNSACHILFECDELELKRSELWQLVENCFPVQLPLSIASMSNVDKCKFILNGFNVKYENEWKPIYDAISNYIYEMTVLYDKLCETN